MPDREGVMERYYAAAPVRSVVYTSSGPRPVGDECFVCGKRWKKDDQAVSTADEPRFRHATCPAPSPPLSTTYRGYGFGWMAADNRHRG